MIPCLIFHFWSPLLNHLANLFQILCAIRQYTDGDMLKYSELLVASKWTNFKPKVTEKYGIFGDFFFFMKNVPFLCYGCGAPRIKCQ